MKSLARDEVMKSEVCCVLQTSPIEFAVVKLCLLNKVYVLNCQVNVWCALIIFVTKNYIRPMLPSTSRLSLLTFFTFVDVNQKLNKVSIFVRSPSLSAPHLKAWPPVSCV